MSEQVQVKCADGLLREVNPAWQEEQTTIGNMRGEISALRNRIRSIERGFVMAKHDKERAERRLHAAAYAYWAWIPVSLYWAGRHAAKVWPPAIKEFVRKRMQKLTKGY